jgi:hypothetical protein
MSNRQSPQVREGREGPYVDVGFRMPLAIWQEINLLAAEGERTFTAQMLRTIRRGLDAEK